MANKIFMFGYFLGITAVYLIVELLLNIESNSDLILSIFKHLFDCCSALFDKFSLFLLIDKVVFAYAVSAFFSAGILDATYNLIGTLRNVRKIKLHAGRKFIHHGIPVRIIDIKGLYLAFTTGFFKTEIFVSKDLWNSLDEEEKKSVLFHELCHAKRRDPLRILIMKFLTDIFFFIPVFKWLKLKFEEFIEKSADDSVISAGVDPLILASALIKVSRKNRSLFTIPSFADINPNLLTSRLTRLIGLSGNLKFKIPVKMLFMTAIMFIVLISSAFVAPENTVKKNGVCCSGFRITSSLTNSLVIEECRKHCIEHRMRGK